MCAYIVEEIRMIDRLFEQKEEGNTCYFNIKNLEEEIFMINMED